MERMQSPLGRVRGLGSARDGAREWWTSRVLSVALVPLTLWWVVSIIAHLHSDYGTFVSWLGSPVNAVLMIVTIFATFYHTALGIQVVLEDYVHHEWVKLAALLATKFACILLGVAGVFAVLRIAFEG